VSADEESSDWPDPAGNQDNQKALYQAKLDLRLKRVEAEIASAAAQQAAELTNEKAHLDDDLARAAAERGAELTSKAAYEQALLDLAKGSLDRARANAEVVQKASSAIVALYTGALALAFSVADHPLPLRGLIPAILLGLAVVASTAYLAYVTDPRSVEGPHASSSLRELARRRIAAFIIWTRAGALARVYWLRVSVLALAASLAFLPAPFLTSSNETKATAIMPATQWPKPPTSTDEMTKILYQAQVSETAELRKNEVAAAETRSSAAGGNEKGWWIGFGVVLALIFLVPLARKPNQAAPTVDDARKVV